MRNEIIEIMKYTAQTDEVSALRNRPVVFILSASHLKPGTQPCIQSGYGELDTGEG